MNERTRIRVHIDVVGVGVGVYSMYKSGWHLEGGIFNQHGLAESDKVRSLSVSAYSISEGADEHARSGVLRILVASCCCFVAACIGKASSLADPAWQ